MTSWKKSAVKRINKGICLVLSLTLMLLCVPAGVAIAQTGETNTTENNTLCYVSLGDSFTSGFGLYGSYPKDYTEDPYTVKDYYSPEVLGYLNSAEGSYPYRVAQELKDRGNTVEHIQLGQSAMRTEDLRYLLDEDYPGDSYTEDWYTKAPENGKKGFWYGRVDELRKAYKESIEKADLITYDLGKNSFGAYLTTYILYGEYDANLNMVLDSCESAAYYGIREKIRALIDKYASEYYSPEGLAAIERLIDGMSYALWSFEKNFDITIDTIQELNPDVDIIVLTLANTSADIDIEIDGITIPLGTLFGSLTDLANTYMLTQSSNRQDLVFADGTTISGGTITLGTEVLEYNGDSSTLDANFKNFCDSCAFEMWLKSTMKYTLMDAYGEAFDEQAFNQAILAGYDAVARIIQSVLVIDPIPMTELLEDGSFEECIETPITSLVTTAYGVVAKAYEDALPSSKGAEEDTPTINEMIQASIDFVASDKRYQAAAALYFRSAFASAWISHPNYDGSEKIADAIIDAWDKGTTARQAFKESTKKLVVRYAQAWKTFGDSFKSQLKASIRDHYAERGTRVDQAVTDLAIDDTDQRSVETIIDDLDLKTAEEVEELYSVVEEAERLASQTTHTHHMVYHRAKLATCTEEGSTAYWQCSECGEMFLDYFGNVPIESTYTVPALGHHYKTVPAVKLFRITIVPSYEVCTTCGEHKH